MAPRRAARLAVLMILVGLAMVSLAPQAARRAAADRPAPGAWFALSVIAALAIPALALMVIAAIRHRPGRRASPPPREREPRGNPLLGALFLLSLLAIAVATMVLLRPKRPEPGATNDPPPTETTRPPGDPGTSEDTPWFLIGVAILAIVLATTALAYRRRNPPPEQTPGRQSDPLATAVEQALRIVVEPASDPKAAIIQCYTTMEDALAAIPGAGPHPSDSPSEVLDRATTTGAIRTPGARRLVELFAEARFSPHAMTEPDRAAAERSLRLILADLGGPR